VNGGRKEEDERRKKKEKKETRRAIPHRRAETKSTLIRYKRFPTCLTPEPYRYRSVIHGEPECTRAHRYRSIASGAVVIVIRYRRALSAKFEPGTVRRGSVRRQGCRFYRRKTNVISRSRQGPRSSQIQPESIFRIVQHSKERKFSNCQRGRQLTLHLPPHTHFYAHTKHTFTRTQHILLHAHNTHFYMHTTHTFTRTQYTHTFRYI